MSAYCQMRHGQPKDEIVGDLTIAVFRLNGRLINTGNQLVMDLGLTSAWWQVLGALARSAVPLPAAHIARNMGLSRQAVQRIVNLLAEKDLVRFEANPHHQRAKLIALTPRGRAAERAATERQKPLARDLVAALGEKRIADALEVLTHIELHLAKTANSADEDAA